MQRKLRSFTRQLTPEQRTAYVRLMWLLLSLVLFVLGAGAPGGDGGIGG